MFRHHLAREVAIVVVVKALVVLAAGLLLFGPAQRIRVDETGMRGRLLDEWRSPPVGTASNAIGGYP